jgi:hypothetical protein
MDDNTSTDGHRLTPQEVELLRYEAEQTAGYFEKVLGQLKPPTLSERVARKEPAKHRHVIIDLGPTERRKLKLRSKKP